MIESLYIAQQSTLKCILLRIFIILSIVWVRIFHTQQTDWPAQLTAYFIGCGINRNTIFIGDNNVNIADMTLGRKKAGETAVIVLNIDGDIPDKVVEELRTTKISERSGRAQDKEEDYMMQKLRSLGYM